MIGSQRGTNPKLIPKKRTNATNNGKPHPRKGSQAEQPLKHNQGNVLRHTKQAGVGNSISQRSLTHRRGASYSHQGIQGRNFGSSSFHDNEYDALEMHYNEKVEVMGHNFGFYQQQEKFYGEKQYEKKSDYGYPRDRIRYVKQEEGKSTPTTNSEDDMKLMSGFTIQINGNTVFRDAKGSPERTTLREKFLGIGKAEKTAKVPLERPERETRFFFGSANVVGPKKCSFPIPIL
jgi:hypothetical protein